MSITGSNNPFACEPVVFANANAIVSLGTITRDGNQFTFSVGFVWKINGVTYQNTAPVVLTIAEASTGFQRIDNALLNTSNTIELQQGLESETIALRPIAPDTNIILTSWNISGDAIGTPTDPITGTQFVKKSYGQPFLFSGSGSDAIIPLDPLGKSEIRLQNPALVSIAGFDLSLITGVTGAELPYYGKPYIIRNLTGNAITIKNESPAADYPFYLSGGGDLVFPNGQAIYALYDVAGFSEIFKSWGDISGKLDKVSTAGVERAYIINPDGSQDVKETSEFGKSRVYTQHPTVRYALNSDLTWKGYHDEVFFFTTFPTISYGTGTEPTLTVISTSQGIVSSEDTKILKSLEFNIYNAPNFEIEIAIYKSDYNFTNDSTAYNVRKIHGSSLVVTSGSLYKTTKIIKTITDYNDTPLGMISKWTIYFKNISGSNFLRYYVDWKFD